MKKKIVHTNTNVSPGSGEDGQPSHTKKKLQKIDFQKKFIFSLFIYFWDNITKLLAKQFEIERTKIIID
jgi:hypothetical protein